MAQPQRIRQLSVKDYLAAEEQSEIRHEYVNGFLQAMVGATRIHNEIAGALYMQLRSHLLDRPCRTYFADVKVRIGEIFYYPDVLVTCETLPTDPRYVMAPCLVAEVLSQSTEARDRFEKWTTYQKIAALEEYLLISQDRVAADIYRRDGSDWLLERLKSGNTLRVASVNLEFPIEAPYIGTDLP